MQVLLQVLLREMTFLLAVVEHSLVMGDLALLLVPVLKGGAVAVPLGVVAVGAALALLVALIAALLLGLIQLKVV